MSWALYAFAALLLFDAVRMRGRIACVREARAIRRAGDAPDHRRAGVTVDDATHRAPARSPARSRSTSSISYRATSPRSAR